MSEEKEKEVDENSSEKEILLRIVELLKDIRGGVWDVERTVAKGLY